MATINKDGTINFSGSKGLLSIEQITRQATKMFIEMQKRRDIWDTQNRVSELRKSCGAEPQYVKIKFCLGAQYGR